MNPFITITRLFRERRLPWRVSNFFNVGLNIYHYFLKTIVVFFDFRVNKEKKKIVFCCGFHGFSGGPIAISSIANILTKRYQVSFVTFPTSNYNKLLNSKVRLVSSIDYLADVFIADEGCEHNLLSEMSSAQGKLIITCHCLKNLLTGLTPDYIYKSFSYADQIHFVGGVQQDDFKIDSIPKIIGNSCEQVSKNEFGRSAGTVGRLTDPDKNAKLSFSIAEKSKLLPFQLWGANAEDFPQKNAIVHGWESDKQKIYNSIDVLVFMSKHETFGLVVIEAMSAGIPCLLSDIPAFQQYRECPGIEFVDLEDTEDAELKLTNLMANKDVLREQLITYWREHYSNDAIAKQWFAFIEDTLTSS